jgi:hypothetical protein
MTRRMWSERAGERAMCPGGRCIGKGNKEKERERKQVGSGDFSQGRRKRDDRRECTWKQGADDCYQQMHQERSSHTPDKEAVLTTTCWAIREGRRQVGGCALEKLSLSQASSVTSLPRTITFRRPLSLLLSAI